MAGRPATLAAMSTDPRASELYHAAQQLGRADEAARRTDEYAAAVAAVRGSVTSEGREVTVEVDSIGRVTGVEFGDSALEVEQDALAQLVLDTAESARRRAGDSVVALTVELYGTDSPIVESTRRHYLGLPEPEAEPDPGGERGFLLGPRR